MRLSSIDIGSNAIRQIIVSVDDHNQWQILKKEKVSQDSVFNLLKIRSGLNHGELCPQKCNQ